MNLSRDFCCFYPESGCWALFLGPKLKLDWADVALGSRPKSSSFEHLARYTAAWRPPLRRDPEFHSRMGEAGWGGTDLKLDWRMIG